MNYSLFTSIIKREILFARAILRQHLALILFLSSFSINLLAFYLKCRALIGYATHYLFKQ